MAMNPTEMRTHYQHDRRAFFRDCLMVRSRDPTATKLTPLALNPAQEALLRSVEKIEAFNLERTTKEKLTNPEVVITKLPVDVVVLKPRKEGMSTLIEALMTHQCEFHPNTNGLVMAHRLDGAQNIAMISRRFFFSWPKALLPIKIEMQKVSDKMLEWHMGDKHNAAWDSRIVIATCKDEGVGRGFDWDFVHLSEVAHMDNGDAISAAKNGMLPLHYCFEESTANGIDRSFYSSFKHSMPVEQVYSYWKKENRLPPSWNGKYRFFWAWWQDPHYTTRISGEEEAWLKNNLDQTELDLVDRFGLDMGRIKWRRTTIATKCSEQSQMSPEDFFRQEYPSEPNEAFVSTGNTVFSSYYVNIMADQAANAKPHYFHGNLSVADDKQLFWQPARSDDHKFSPAVKWERPKDGHEYVIGVDVANGKSESPGGDMSVIMVFDRCAGNKIVEVARFEGKPAPKDLADIIRALHIEYNRAYVICEANYPGNSTIERLVDLRVAPMYHRKNEEQVGGEPSQSSFIPGWKTYPNTKALLVGALQESVRNKQMLARSEELCRQLSVFTNVDGKFTHPPGDKDDYVIAAGLANYAHFHAAPPVRTQVSAEEALREKDTEESLMAKMVRRKIERDHRKNRIAERQRQRRRPVPMAQVLS